MTQPHEPLAPIGLGAESAGHFRSHVEPPLQLTEHVSVHVMWQVEPPEQSTLALGPTVIAHVDCPEHFKLHESPHAPEQSFEFEQSSEQLVPHVSVEIVHDVPLGQAHVAPLQVGGVLESPQAMIAKVKKARVRRIG